MKNQKNHPFLVRSRGRNPPGIQDEEPRPAEDRRRFLKLTALGLGSGLAFTQLGCRPPAESGPSAEPETPQEPAARPPRDVVDPGVLVNRNVGGTVTSAEDRAIYDFEVSATYGLTGQEISIEGLKITGTPAAGRGAGTIAISKASELRGTLNASNCFRITGGVAVSDAKSEFYSAKVDLDGCMVSDAVPSIRGVVRRDGAAEVASVKITFS